MQYKFVYRPSPLKTTPPLSGTHDIPEPFYSADGEVQQPGV